MKIKILITLLVLTFALDAMAQQTENKPAAPAATPPAAPPPSASATPQAPPPPPANPADVATMDAIIKAVYDVISGPAGQQRDWNRFRSLFHPSARMIPTGKNPNTGVHGARAFTPDQYIERSEPFMMKEGFFEREKARRTELYGNIAHVFSTYESFHKPDETTPFMRGINSIQLLNDGKRWWVLTIMWQGETPDAPLPEKYLTSGQ